MILAYYIFTGLMLAGNAFGLYQFLTGKEAFLQKFPAVTEKNFIVLQLLPVVNMIGLAGMLFYKSWSPWIAIPGAAAVIAADINFGIRYHLYLAVPATLILLLFIYNFRNQFK